MKKILLSILFSLVFVSALSVKTYADGTYTVNVDGGLHGTSTGNGSSIPADTELTVERNSQTEMVVRNGKDVIYTITVSDSKYYLKGVHYAGQYLSESDLVTSIPVTEDLILVASYGIPGDQVSYIVSYEDASGNELHPADTFYANNGEKVLVGARYVDGYTVSNTKAFTGTAKEGLTFRFVYVPTSGGSSTIIDDGTTYVYEEGTGGGGGGTGGGGAAPVTPAPAEIIDIDEPEVPQAEPEPSTPGQNEPEPEIIEPEPVPTASFWQTLISHPLLLGGSVVSLGLLMWLIIMLATRRKGDNA